MHMDSTNTVDVIGVAKALGDETRARIVGVLGVRALCVCEVKAALSLSHAIVSDHVRVSFSMRGSCRLPERATGRYTRFVKTCCPRPSSSGSGNQTLCRQQTPPSAPLMQRGASVIDPFIKR